MSGLVPGKILVVDNDENDVKQIIGMLRDAGEAVIYRPNAPPEGECPSNVRLVILDLDLDGCGSITPEDLAKAVLVLQRLESRTRFYLVALWSHYVTASEDFKDEFRTKYQEQTGKVLPDYMLISFGKRSLTQKSLAKELRNWLQGNPYATTIMQWENAIDDSRDSAISDLTSTVGIDSVVRSMSHEVGKEAVARQLSMLLNRVLLRQAAKESRILAMKPGISKILSSSSPLGVNGPSEFSWYAKFHYLQAYFPVGTKEPIWTGDILKRKHPAKPERQYAVVITPACDLAQKKVQNVKVVFGTEFLSIPEYSTTDENVPHIVVCFGNTRDGKFKKRNDVVDALAGLTNTPERLFMLHFIKSSPTAEGHFHVLFDFSHVDLITCKKDVGGNLKVPAGWGRLCRVDSPYVEDLIQKYATFSSRLGTPSIPETIKKELAKQLKN